MEQRLERTNNDSDYDLRAVGFGQSVVTSTTAGAMVVPVPASPASTKTGKENARVSASSLDAELSNRRKVKALRTRSRARANADDAMDIDEPPSTRLENITNQSLPEDVRQDAYDSDDRVLPVLCPEDDGWTPGTENDDHPLVEASAQPPEVFPTPLFVENDGPPDDGFWPSKGDIDHMEVFRASTPPLPWYEENPPKIKKRSAREGEDLRLKVLENNLKIHIHDTEEARAVLLRHIQQLARTMQEQETGDTSFSFDDHDSEALPDAPMVVEPFQLAVPTAEPLFSSLPSDYDRPGTPCFDAPSGSVVAPAPAPAPTSEDSNLFLPGFLLYHPPSPSTHDTDPFVDLLQPPPSGVGDTTYDHASSSTAVLSDQPLPSFFDDITTFSMADTPAPVDPTWALSLLPQPAAHSNYFAPSLSLDFDRGKSKAPAVRPTCSRFTTNSVENACWTEYARERLLKRRQRLLRKLNVCDLAHGIKDLPLDESPPVVPMEKRAREKEWRDKFEDYVMIFCGPSTKGQ
ncbi:hypothetical protein EXIGLDRAFT_845735 [Exidia glandulosa HHB12029]|uniref:Uncharacterized protein n=1 Tax=Exidia glandulosa HHB12029 TaxID=1314781 RepID=A0A165BAY3_EXIGL|nr:hypothetical protein EXIGLDRAFT_845735 [Exidia glandulosa HHB12029]